MDNQKHGDNMVGIILIAVNITGGAGLLVAVFAFFRADWAGAGLGLIASAVAFGLTLNALLRS